MVGRDAEIRTRDSEGATDHDIADQVGNAVDRSPTNKSPFVFAHRANLEGENHFVMHISHSPFLNPLPVACVVATGSREGRFDRGFAGGLTCLQGRLTSGDNLDRFRVPEQVFAYPRILKPHRASTTDASASDSPLANLAADDARAGVVLWRPLHRAFATGVWLGGSVTTPCSLSTVFTPLPRSTQARAGVVQHPGGGTAADLRWSSAPRATLRRAPSYARSRAYDASRGKRQTPSSRVRRSRWLGTPTRFDVAAW